MVAGGYGYRIQILVLQCLTNILNTLGAFTLFAFNGAGTAFKEPAVRVDEIGNLHIFHAQVGAHMALAATVNACHTNAHAVVRAKHSGWNKVNR